MLDVITPQNTKICEQCGGSFTPRERSGGKPQRFCSPDCRTAFHDAQRSQRSPTWSAETATSAPDHPFKTVIAPVDDSETRELGPEALVCNIQAATWVYRSQLNDIAIRQDQNPFQNEEVTIYICPQNVDALINKLRSVAASIHEDEI